MAVEIHVDGRIAQGRLTSIRLTYRYEDLNAYEDHEARTLRDVGYAEAASGMEFVEGTLAYSVFREVE